MKNISFYKGGSAFCYLIIIGFLLSCTPVLANKLLRQLQSLPQQIQVSGTITDGTSPLPGVSITIKGKATTATISDFNGQYTITASPDDTLVFDFMGFKTTTVPISGRKIIHIQLQEDITSLQEVRVNAGYYSVKEKERTGSIARISVKDIEKQPINNPLAAMQGRMSGVNITQNTGLPGGGFSIQVRGINSIRSTGNDPLYIIDGVPYPSQSLGSSDVSNGILPNVASPLNSLNPSDIESIEVLKDADATAIYGSRGANGVILISTKKGKAGATRFNINTYTSVGTVARKLDVLNTSEYLVMREKAFTYDGITEYPETAFDVNGTWNRARNTDWQKELLGGTANIFNVQASVSGGTNETQFLMSGTFRNETTVFPGEANYKKGAFHNSVSHRTKNDTFRINFVADYVADKNALPGMDLTRQAYMLAPNAPALYDDTGNLNWENGTFENPLAYLKGNYITKTQNLIANTTLSYKFFEGLELKTNLGYNNMQLEESRAIPSTMYNPLYNLSSEYAESFLNNATRQSWILEPQLNFHKSWTDAKLEVLLGATFQSQQEKMLSIYAQGFPSDALINNLIAASNITILKNNLNQYRYNAAFGRLNYIWKKRYIANVTGRRDGSSRFGPDNRFANFGAVGMVWIFSKEPFIKNDDKILSFGKLRTSYGITGNDQIGDYQFLDTYEVTSNIYDGVTGIKPTRLFNPDFGWETNKKLEVALDLGFFKDRLLFTVAWFQNRSSNQLVGVPLPGTTGFPSIQANLDATVQNRGLELDLQTTNVQGENFKWTTSLNITLPKNELLEFPNLEGSTYANTLVIGKSLNIKKLYHYTGINPETGVYTFEDYNGDGKITAAADRQIVADNSPKYYGGLENQLSYKNWNLDFLLQFVKQKGTNIQASFPITGSLSNQPVSVVNHWPENDSNAVGQIYTTGKNGQATTAYNNFVRSDAIITDASFIRLKSVSLTYALPSQGSKTFTCKIYIQGQNLLTLTKFQGVDPENQSFSYLAPLRQIAFGLQLGF